MAATKNKMSIVAAQFGKRPGEEFAEKETLIVLMTINGVSGQESAK